MTPISSLKDLRQKQITTGGKSPSQQEAAEGIGCTRSQYANIEIGNKLPNFRLAFKIAKYYKITIDELANILRLE